MLETSSENSSLSGNDDHNPYLKRLNSRIQEALEQFEIEEKER